MLKNWVKQAVMQDSATQNSCWQNSFTLTLASFNSEVIDKEIYRVALLKIPQYDCTHLSWHKEKKCRAKNNFPCDKWSVSHLWCLTVSQSKLVHIRLIIVIIRVQITGLTDVTTVSNSFFMSYVKSMTNSSSLNRQAHTASETVNLLACNFAKCSHISKSCFVSKPNRKCVVKWSPHNLLHRKHVATLPCDFSSITMRASDFASFPILTSHKVV